MTDTHDTHDTDTAADGGAMIVATNDGNNARSSWSIPGDVAKAAVSHFEPDVRELLNWLYYWAISPKVAKSMDEVAELVRVDKTTIFRVYRGTYRDGGGKLIVPSKLVSGIKALKRVEDARRDDGKIPFVETQTAKRIFTVCDLALMRGRVGMIWGKSQTGKTSALQEYQRTHNHGQTKYICIEPSSGTHELVRLLAIACGLSPKGAHDEMKRRIIRCLDKNNLLIVDEVHQFAFTYRARSKLSCLELLRWIHDQTGCGLVLCGTNVWRDDLAKGKDKDLLEQLARRGAVKLQLPDAPTAADLAEIYKAFGLDKPTGDDADTMNDLAKRCGLTVVTETIAFGQRRARKAGRESVCWDDVMAAHAILEDLEHPAK